jgi:hypothetical protein
VRGLKKPGSGRNGLTAPQVLRSLVLMRVKNWETSHPNQVMTIFEWAQINRISMRTARRILGSGTGPVVTQLSANRVGVTVANNAKWQASRARG